MDSNQDLDAQRHDIANRNNANNENRKVEQKMYNVKKARV